MQQLVHVHPDVGPTQIRPPYKLKQHETGQGVELEVGAQVKHTECILWLLAE